MKIRDKFPAILFSVFFLLILISFQVFGWLSLKYWGVAAPRPFVDLQSVLGSADCYREMGFQIYNFPIGHPCAYNYGSYLMRFISATGVGVSLTFAIGIFFFIIFSVLVGVSTYYLKLKGYKSFAFLTLILLSPPVLLLFERGNLDILIYVLVFAAALAIARGWILSSIVVLFASALFKFYPFVLFVFQATLHRVKWRLIYLVPTTFGAIQIIHDYKSGPGFINTAWTSFGAPVAGFYLEYLGVKISYKYSLILGFFLLLFAIIIVLRLQQSKSFLADLEINRLFPNTYLKSIYVCNLVVHISCYVLGMSFDYRLIFLATSCILITFSPATPNYSRKIVSASIILILWTSVNAPILQPIGDLLIGILTGFFVVQIIRYWFLNQSEYLVTNLQSFRVFLRSFSNS